MSSKHIIIGVNITSFAKNSVNVQKVFCEYGCSIRTRLGLHDANEGECAPNGLILLDFTGGDEKADEMVEKLTKLEGVEVKQMVF